MHDAVLLRRDAMLQLQAVGMMQAVSANMM